MHRLAVVQDTELSVLNTAVPGLSRAGIRFQVAPFHSSETANPCTWPTARHDEADVHATPLNSVVLEEKAGLVGWIVHFFPFQRSASACTGCGNDAELPTAVHALAAVHDTALRSRVAPAGFGVGVIDQPVAPATGASASKAIATVTPAADTRQRRPSTTLPRVNNFTNTLGLLRSEISTVQRVTAGDSERFAAVTTQTSAASRQRRAS